jgi:selenocysteine lyase/cysteine desulfurase
MEEKQISVASETAENQKNRKVPGWNFFIPTTIEDLLRTPEEKYTPPVLPVELPTFPDPKTEKFGHDFRKAHFFLEPVTYLNHGAFGSTLKEAMEVVHKWQVHCDKQPLRFFDREMMPILVYVVRRMASFIGAPPSNVVLLPNVTDGLNCVLRSLSRHFDSDDSICYFNTTYGMTKALLSYLKREFGVKSYQIDIEFPVQSKEDIITTFQTNLRANTRLVILDHIAAGFAIVSPVKEIIDYCHKQGILVLVDGAHAFGNTHLDMSSLDPDFYIANCHKWFCSPKGCAFMYVASKHKKLITPLSVTHGMQYGFSSSFIFGGTRDYSAWLSIPTVLEFWNHYGPERIRDYIHTTVMTGAEIITKELGTSFLADKSLFGPMAAVELPLPPMYADADIVTAAIELKKLLYNRYTIEVPVKVCNDKLFVRLSAHVHNELSEFQHLADAMSDLMLE